MRIETYDNEGRLTGVETVADAPVATDPIVVLQAQLDALTDIVLAGGM